MIKFHLPSQEEILCLTIFQSAWIRPLRFYRHLFYLSHTELKWKICNHIQKKKNSKVHIKY